MSTLRVNTITPQSGSLNQVSGSVLITNALTVSGSAFFTTATFTQPINAGTVSGSAALFSGTVTATTFVGALTGNASTATALQTARTLWGQSFNGSANVTGALSSVTDITMTGTLSGATTVSATTLTGTLSTGTQPNVTSVGTLSSLTVSGNSSLQGILLAGPNMVASRSRIARPRGSYIGWQTSGGSGTEATAIRGTTGDAFELFVNGALRWSISSSGHFLAGADNTYDIGASGATRPRNVFVAGNITAGGSGTLSSLTVSGKAYVQSAGVPTSGFYDGLAVSAWDAIGWTGTDTLVVGGYRATQWGSINFYTGGTSKAILDGSGNLGLGVTPSQAGLTLLNTYNLAWGESGGTSYANLFRQTSSAATIIANGYKQSANANAFASSTGVNWAKSAIALGVATGGITFYTDTATTVANGTDTTPTERMRLDASGNLGLGVTPSAWTIRALQIGAADGAFVTGQSGQLTLGVNAFFDGAWKYGATGTASYYEQSLGGHRWYAAASGSPPNSITWGSAKMTLDASGNLGVGTPSPACRIHSVPASVSAGLSAAFIGTQTGTGADTGTSIRLGYNSTSGTYAEIGGAFQSPGMYLTFRTSVDNSTAPAERARITAAGYTKHSNDGTYVDASGAYHEFRNTADAQALIVSATNASFGSQVVDIYASRNTTNGSFNAIRYYNTGAAANRFVVADSGNVTNTNGSYGTISDAKHKTDIVDAGSQWDNLKGVRFRKFKMKGDPSGTLMLGVVAQELELVSPGLIEEHTDRDADGNDLGTTTKSVKTSILFMKAAVALQEAMARIETLEQRVMALEA